MDLDGSPQVVAEVFVDLLAVLPRQDDAGETAAVRGEHLLLDAADREHLPGEGDLAGHGQVAADRAPRQRGHQRRRHRDPGRGPLDRRRVGLHVQMDVGVALEGRVEAVAARRGPAATTARCAPTPA